MVAWRSDRFPFIFPGSYLGFAPNYDNDTCSEITTFLVSISQRNDVLITRCGISLLLASSQLSTKA